MKNYMLLQSKNVQIPLLAKNGVWKFKINGVAWELLDCMECLYGYWIIGDNNLKETAGTLRANNKHITPMEIDAFVEYYKHTHPITEHQFALELVPLYATNKRALCIPNCFGYNAYITMSQEEELISLIKSNPRAMRENLKQWFWQYVNNYDFVPKRKSDIPYQYEDLAVMFCRIHGINYFALCFYPRANQYRRTKQTPAQKITSTITSTLILAIGICLYVSIIGVFWSWSEAVDNVLLEALFIFIGFAMIGVPLYLIFGDRNDTFKR